MLFGCRCVRISPLSLLALVRMSWSEEAAGRNSGNRGVKVFFRALLDRHAHVTTVAALATIALILAHATICRYSSVLASSAWALTITAFLALTAPLTARLRRQVLLVVAV
jgi:hypothetical protein